MCGLLQDWQLPYSDGRKIQASAMQAMQSTQKKQLRRRKNRQHQNTNCILVLEIHATR